METLKTTMRKKAKTVFAKFSMPSTLASKADEKLVLSVSSIDDVQFFITQKNDVAAVNFAFDALDGNNAVLILETGEEAQKNIGVYIDDFAESFGGPVKAFLPSDPAIFKFLKKRGAALVDSVGIATAGRSIDEAICNMEVLLKSNIIKDFIGQNVSSIARYAQKMNRLYKSRSAKNQKRLRQSEVFGAIPKTQKLAGKETLASLVFYLRKLSSEDMVQGSRGLISVRYGDNMFITPYGISPDFIEEKDIVKASLIRRCPTKNGLKLHKSVYELREDVGAIIMAQPIYASVNASAMENLAVSERMQNIIGQVVPVSEWAFPLSSRQAQNVVKELKNTNAVFMGCSGVLVVGKTLQDAFWILSALEDECQKVRSEQDF